MPSRMLTIAKELRNHAPFTALGASTGILCMLLFKDAGTATTHSLFLVFHPAHVVLSAMVTASLFKIYQGTKRFLVILAVGYCGSIGTATLSDCVLPYFGESILGVAVPRHEHIDRPNQQTHDELNGTSESTTAETPHANGARPSLHLGFIEDWYVVNPAALLGIAIAYFWPHTKFPHAGHILVSTWASSFHILMNTHKEPTGALLVGIFVVLFISVWLPCCISDIVFPLLFVKAPGGLPHSHDHIGASCHHEH